MEESDNASLGLLGLDLSSLETDCSIVADASLRTIVEVSQVEGIVRESLTIELNQVCVVFLCELPQNTVGNLHLPTDTLIKIPYLLVKTLP